MLRQLGHLFRYRWRRIGISLLPVLVALLHISGVLHLPVLERLDHIIYDSRLRATMPRTLDERIVIIDIDEKSLERIGQWPWGRDKLATLSRELLDRQQAAVLGFDVIFAEADGSSGLESLQKLAQGPLKEQPGFADQLTRLAPTLDYDALFADSLAGKPAVLGFYFSSDRDGRVRGVLPAPALSTDSLRGLPLRATSWNGYGANIEGLARSAPVAGFFNSITDEDGVVRSLPLLAEHGGQYYESLALAVFRTMMGMPRVLPGYANLVPVGTHDPLKSLLLHEGGSTLELPVDDRLATLIPFRGPGDVAGGSYQYISASDALEGALAPGHLRDKVVLVGSTAPGLMDLRATPVGRTYPGVETHANVLSALLDGRSIVRPDYVVGFDALQLMGAGLLLAVALPMVSALPAVMLSLVAVGVLCAINLWMYMAHGLALPLSTAVVMVLSSFALNMVYGYLVESRSKRELASLFGTYVPPELVDEMVKEPDSYSMEATSRELTVMFCDMRGFTAMSERMDPLQLQALLNEVFSTLTQVIRNRRGTIDKYMGDCVMAFWGAPVATPDHATLAVEAAMEMVAAIEQVNIAHRRRGLPEIGVGIGLNTGVMCVGDMGSDIRRSYTVIGDAVNLASRLEGLSKHYGTSIVVSESTRAQAPRFAWQQLDLVRVKGKSQAVGIYRPVGEFNALVDAQQRQLREWQEFLYAYLSGDLAQCRLMLDRLHRNLPTQAILVQLYEDRLNQFQNRPPLSEWDPATTFDTK
jgi:adenylate cyclase